MSDCTYTTRGEANLGYFARYAAIRVTARLSHHRTYVPLQPDCQANAYRSLSSSLAHDEP